VTNLDSPVWSQLQHAYGSAEDIPPLLRQLSSDPRPQSDYQEEPWFSLWSALCHQGDVYTASYAAVPHVVEIGIKAAGPIHASFFQLPACVEVARLTGRGPAIGPDLAPAYFASLAKLHECAFVHARDSWDGDMAMSVAAALAAAKGQAEVAQAIINLDEDIIARINRGDF
jgi:hypothetical protein